MSGLVLSLGFWGCLFAAAVLFGGVSLAARVVEREQLEQEQAARQSELLTLQSEVTHLRKVADGLAADTRLRASVARHELQRPPEGVRAIPLAGRLRHDPREQSPVPIDVEYREPVYLTVLQSLAQSPERRLRWSLIAAGLLVFGFVCLHENAGSRAIGRAILIPLYWLDRRYVREKRSAGEE